MAEAAETDFRVRLTEQLAEDFAALVQETGKNRGEIFTLAFAMYRKAKHAQAEGGTLWIKGADGGMTQLVGF